MEIKKNNVILKKIIILFLIIVLPLILFSSISLIQSNNKLTKEMLDSYAYKIKGFTESLDDEFREINRVASTISVHSKVRKLSYTSFIMDPFEKTQAILQVREYISSVKNNSNLIHNIKIYISPLLQAYNASGYDKGSYEEFTPEEYNQIINLKSKDSQTVFYHNNRLKTIILSSINAPANIVEINFSTSQLRKILNSQNSYDNSYYILNFNDGNYIMDNVKDISLYNKILSINYKDGIAKIEHDKSRYQVFYTKLNYVNATYIQIIPTNVFLDPLRLSNLYTIFLFIFMFSCVIIFFLGVVKIIHRPLLKLINAFQSVETGDLSIRIHENEESDFSYLYHGFNDMADHLETVIDEVYNQNLLLQKAEFKQLQAQINPHFLYNSFFMLHRMIQNRMQEESVKVSKELGVYFKYITKNSSDFEYFKDEYRHAKIYSNIQAMRFEGRITTNFDDLPEQYELIQVPRLILQPIIENAYNYGLENKISDGFLRVSFVPSSNGLYVIIEDNGEDLSDIKINQINNSINDSKDLLNSKEVTGLLNISKRIQIFYKNDSSLFVSRSDLGGMKVTIFLSI